MTGAPASAPPEVSGAPSRAVRAVIWLPGLAVAVGAAVATAHGLYEVAVAARVPTGIAWLYPLITDGLALVAYTATARLSGSAARYAWAVVVLAAGLSGLAQAMYLASDTPDPAGGAIPPGSPVAGPVFEATAVLRFGVGAWPAVAAAIVAHLLYLLATHTPGTDPPTANHRPAEPEAFTPPPVQPDPPAVQPGPASAVQIAVQPSVARAVQRPVEVTAIERGRDLPVAVEQSGSRSGVSPARDRARAAAVRLADDHGALPTVTELETVAQVSRGTAAAALKALREQPTPLHLLTPTELDDTERPDARTQP